MTASLFFKVSLIWLLIAALAIGNGIFRENILVPGLGQGLALPLSGISLSIIVIIVTYLFFSFFGQLTSQGYLLIGIQWVLMTLIFEFVFGHYVAGKSWTDILQVFNVMKGNLFVLVLLSSLLAPFTIAKLKSVI